jgi:chromate transporter
MQIEARRGHLRELAVVFLRLGLTAFGGPAAHVAIMEDELVRRRRWLTHERFLDLLGAANLIPGPSSTELAIYIGYERAGWRGLVLGGTCFILPAASMVGALAWAYVRFGSLPALAGVLYGIKPVVIGVAIQALWGLATKALKKSWWLGAIGAGACVASALGVEAVAVLVGAGALTAIARRPVAESGRHGFFFGPAVSGVGGITAGAANAGLLTLFLTFLKIGAVVFGSGYVLLAFLRADLVDRLHWLTEAQLLDAVAVGQVTPGPVFTTATFIGYVVGARQGETAGLLGAVVATVGIFLPGFLLVVLTRPLVDRLRRSRVAGAFLDGVNVAALALMGVVTVQLGHAALVDVATVLVVIVATVALVGFKVNTTWLIAGGAVVGAGLRALS